MKKDKIICSNKYCVNHMYIGEFMTIMGDYDRSKQENIICPNCNRRAVKLIKKKGGK